MTDYEDDLPHIENHIFKKGGYEKMKPELDEWKWLKQAQNEIGNHLRKSKFRQGVVTVEQRDDKFILTAIIAKDGELKIHPDDVPVCKHILG